MLVRRAGNDIIQSITIDIINLYLWCMLRLAFGKAADCQRVFYPLAFPRVSRCLIPGIRPQNIRTTIAVDVTNPSAERFFILANFVFSS